MAALVEDWRRRAAAPVEDREPADIEHDRGSPQPESWTGGGAANARTRRAGVYVCQHDLGS